MSVGTQTPVFQRWWTPPLRI